MFDTSSFSFLDKKQFLEDQANNIGDFPRSRSWKKLIHRGFIILDKPAGPTSNDTVSTVKKILEINKAGHSGTLDPAVSGVLPIGLEDGTKILSVFAKAKKRYICNMRLNKEVGYSIFTEKLSEMQGQLYQFPPLKSNVARKLRKRTVYNIELLDHNNGDYLLDIECQAGTYIRTFCVDMGRILGVPGRMKELRRTVSAGFHESSCITLHQLFDAVQDAKEGLGEEKIREVVLPVEEVIKHLPAIIVRNNAIPSIVNGANIAVPAVLANTNFRPSEDIRILSTKGELVAVGESLQGSEFLENNSNGIIVHPSKVVFSRDEYHLD